MMRFDYLHDTELTIMERLRSILMIPYAQAPLLAMLLLIVIESTIQGMLHYQLVQASAQVQAADRVYVVTRAALERMKLEHTQVESLLQVDRRIRQIRASGSVAAERMLDVADHLPAHAWLTSLSRTKHGEMLSGRADNLQSVGDVVSDMMSASTVTGPELVDARLLQIKEAPKMVAFRLLVTDRSK